ncbi:MAG: DUF86 domain-containing protein [Candidatus Kapabacteria bacterium]|jgi:uncharacterized protein with HEPN domain|nr:DUF86 domain-containing protein [Candidatus Kapabacteria bacterium]
MFSDRDKAILEFVLQMISEAEIVVERHGSAYLTLNDIEGKNSILLNILQIGEKLNKIESKEIRNILPISEAYSIRNRITHDYDGIDLEIVEEILIEEFPLLKQNINNLLV